MQGEDYEKLIYKDLSYKIVGALFTVFNEIGGGYQEKIYQRALELELLKAGIRFVPQSPYRIEFHGQLVGRYYLDFVIEEKIILEIKKGNYFSINNIKQVTAYLKKTGLKLAILANFTSTDVRFKRIVNLR